MLYSVMSILSLPSSSLTLSNIAVRQNGARRYILLQNLQFDYNITFADTSVIPSALSLLGTAASNGNFASLLMQSTGFSLTVQGHFTSPAVTAPASSSALTSKQGKRSIMCISRRYLTML
jgi:hypothetical protein